MVWIKVSVFEEQEVLIGRQDLHLKRAGTKTYNVQIVEQRMFYVLSWAESKNLECYMDCPQYITHPFPLHAQQNFICKNFFFFNSVSLEFFKFSLTSSFSNEASQRWFRTFWHFCLVSAPAHKAGDSMIHGLVTFGQLICTFLGYDRTFISSSRCTWEVPICNNFKRKILSNLI